MLKCKFKETLRLAEAKERTDQGLKQAFNYNKWHCQEDLFFTTGNTVNNDLHI